MPKKACPLCGLVHTGDTQKCDCGYDLTGAPVLRRRADTLSAPDNQGRQEERPRGHMFWAAVLGLIFGATMLAVGIVCAVVGKDNARVFGGQLIGWGIVGIFVDIACWFVVTFWFLPWASEYFATYGVGF